jgi:predicted DNA-binding transcriptional regulator YafY
MWHSTQSVDRNDDGSMRLTKEGMVRMQFRVRGFNEIKFWVLQLGSFARVVKPEGLRRAVLDELKAMGERHGS